VRWGEPEDAMIKAIMLASVLFGVALISSASANAKNNAVHHSDITITKQTDKGSPKLYESVSKGTHIKKTTVHAQ
jgi:type VI protein secretion system component Hcp